MTIQSQLNLAAFEQLPIVFSAMKKSDQQTCSNMQTYVFNKLMNISPCLDDMTQCQKSSLDAEIIDVFKYRGYINE